MDQKVNIEKAQLQIEEEEKRNFCEMENEKARIDKNAEIFTQLIQKYAKKDSNESEKEYKAILKKGIDAGKRFQALTYKTQQLQYIKLRLKEFQQDLAFIQEMMKTIPLTSAIFPQLKQQYEKDQLGMTDLIRMLQLLIQNPI